MLSRTDGTAFLETMNLDGETNLKVRESLEATHKALTRPSKDSDGNEAAEMVGAGECLVPPRAGNARPRGVAARVTWGRLEAFVCVGSGCREAFAWLTHGTRTTGRLATRDLHHHRSVGSAQQPHASEQKQARCYSSG